MTKDRALTRARVIGTGGRNGTIEGSRYRVDTGGFECEIILVTWFGEIALREIMASGPTWDAAVAAYERRVRGADVRLLPEEADALLDGEVPDALRAWLSEIAEGGAL